MPRSIDDRSPDRQGGEAPRLSVRMDPEILAWLQARPEGPRAFIEGAARREMGREAPDRDWWFRHITQLVSGAVRDVQRQHDGEPLAGSVAKRVAGQLYGEMFGRPWREE